MVTIAVALLAGTTVSRELVYAGGADWCCHQNDICYLDVLYELRRNWCTLSWCLTLDLGMLMIMFGLTRYNSTETPLVVVRRRLLAVIRCCGVAGCCGNRAITPAANCSHFVFRFLCSYVYL